MKFITLICCLGFSLGMFAQNTYHISVNGDNSNDGSLQNPFKTISKAAGIATAGDTVFIHSGTYEETITPANSGTAVSPIVFQSYQNDKVIISAMQALTGWTLDAGNVYKTSVGWDLEQENFVMNDTIACDLARWPNNTDGDPFTIDSKRNEGGSPDSIITDAFLTHSSIPNYDWSKGGSVFFYGDKPGAGWLAWKAFITGSSAGKVTFNLNKNPTWIRTVHAPEDYGDFYLEGIKEAIDYDNEWFFDNASNTLYIQIPGGVQPTDSAIKMRKRLYTIDINNKNYIEVKNLAVFGGSIEISGSDNSLIGISSFYGNSTRGIVTGFKTSSRSVNIKNTATNTSIINCEIAYGSGNGINDDGVSSLIKNSSIHDFNYLGCYDAPILARGGSRTKIIGNRIYRGGRDGIQIINKDSEFAYNDIFQSNLIADDCALLYTINVDIRMKIHHNWFHDNYGRGKLYKAAGVYLDNNPSDVEVYNNVIWNTEWSAIQINWNGIRIDVFNNTLWDCSAAMGAWHKDGTSFEDVRVWNNLTNMNSLEEQADKQNNKIESSDADPFMDYKRHNFMLKDGESAIDYGREIDGITDGFVGAAPDAGAYEKGGTEWLAGIDWDPRKGPTGNGLYGLPGETNTADLDGDGVSNNYDLCPYSVEGQIVDTNGCPLKGLNTLYPSPEKVDVFPNPANGNTLTVFLPEYSVNEVKWSIYSVKGSLISEGITSGANKFTVDIANMQHGMYILSIKSANNNYVTKILKQ